jgi:hypothetical protein
LFWENLKKDLAWFADRHHLPAWATSDVEVKHSSQALLKFGSFKHQSQYKMTELLNRLTPSKHPN